MLSFPVHALSQGQYKPPDRMKMLTAFNGEWKGEMVKKNDKKTVRYKLSHNSEKLAGGWGIQITEIAMIPEKGKYQSAKIFSCSSISDSTYMYTIDNFGETWFFTGIWETNKKLVLHSRMDVKGKTTEKEITYQFVNPKQYDYKSITKVTGSPDEVVEMTMQRE
jgi:hypothetical protein